MPGVVEVASAVSSRIYAAGHFQYKDDGGIRNALWYDLASTKIALIAGDAPIRYVDHNIDTGDSEQSVIVAFTDVLVIVIDLNFREKPVIAKTRVIPRSSLTSLSVGDLTNAIGRQSQAWPSKLAITLTYGDAEFQLPFRYGSNVAELAALVPSVALDLDRR